LSTKSEISERSQVAPLDEIRVKLGNIREISVTDFQKEMSSNLNFNVTKLKTSTNIEDNDPAILKLLDLSGFFLSSFCRLRAYKKGETSIDISETISQYEKEIENASKLNISSHIRNGLSKMQEEFTHFKRDPRHKSNTFKGFFNEEKKYIDSITRNIDIISEL